MGVLARSGIYNPQAGPAIYTDGFQTGFYSTGGITWCFVNYLIYFFFA